MWSSDGVECVEIRFWIEWSLIWKTEINKELWIKDAAFSHITCTVCSVIPFSSLHPLTHTHTHIYSMYTVVSPLLWQYWGADCGLIGVSCPLLAGCLLCEMNCCHDAVCLHSAHCVLFTSLQLHRCQCGFQSYFEFWGILIVCHLIINWTLNTNKVIKSST